MPSVTKQTIKTTAKKPSGGVLDRLPSGWDFSGFKILLYGQSGSGKTTLWASFPKPILAIICSGRSQPGEMLSINTPENRKNITPVVINETGDVRELIGIAGDFATVVLDHVSGLQDYSLKEILGLDEIPAQKSWGMATQQQYGQSTMMCKEILRGLLNIKGNVVIIGQERSTNADENQSEILSPTIGVATTPSLAGWLYPTVDYVCQTYKRPRMIEVDTKIGDKVVKTQKRGRGVDFCLRTEQHDIYTTKFRVPKGNPLPECIVDPTYEKLKKLINGE